MEPTPRGSWWQRNWKWFVPAGCFGLLLLAAAAVAGILFFVASAMKSSDAYRLAFERARGDCEVQEALGAPVEAGWFTSGSVNVTGPAGDAVLSIPLRGARGEGTLYATATKSAGRWSFDLLELEVAGREERIGLLDESRARCE